MHRVGYIYEVKWDAFTDPPSGHTTETSVGTNGSRVIGVELSFRPGGGFEGTGFDPRCSRTPLPLLRRSKNPPGFFVTTNLHRGSLVVSFLYFFLLLSSLEARAMDFRFVCGGGPIRSVSPGAARVSSRWNCTCAISFTYADI